MLGMNSGKQKCWTAWKRSNRCYSKVNYILSSAVNQPVYSHSQTKYTHAHKNAQSSKKRKKKSAVTAIKAFNSAPMAHVHSLHSTWTLWRQSDRNEKKKMQTQTHTHKTNDVVTHSSSVLHSSLHHVNVICCDNKCITKKKSFLNFL